MLNHVFIAHPLDSNHFLVSFYTSHGVLRAKDGKFIENIKCKTEISKLKFVNKPFTLHKKVLREYVKIDENFESINRILRLGAINKEKKN